MGTPEDRMADTYVYQVRDRGGKLLSGSLQADSEALVLQRLRDQGYTPLEINLKKTGLSSLGSLQIGGKKIKGRDKAVFSRQFATMVNSGLPILRALAILADQTDHKEFAKALTGVRMDVEQGGSLSSAMQKHPNAFNDLYISMIKSGETGGVLDDVMLRLATMIEKENELRSRIKSAMTCRVAVVALVGLIMAAL